MTLYLMIRGYGFLWQLGGVDVAHAQRVVIKLRLHWGNAFVPVRAWQLAIVDHSGLEWREKSPAREGAWRLTGPWQKVSEIGA